MKKIDPVVIKETMRILIGSIVLGAIMNAVFLMLRCWNLPVLFGTLLGTAGAVLNFFLMAQTVSRSVTLQQDCLLYTSPSPRDMRRSRMPSSA